MARKGKTGVTPMEEKFCQAYVLGMGNASEAVRVAGFKTKYPDRMGYNLRRKVDIRKRIAQLQDEYHDQLMITDNQLLQEVAALARFNPQDLYDQNGNLKKITDMDRETAIAVQEITHRTESGGDSAEITLIKAGKDKMNAIDRLLKHRKLLDADVSNEIHVNLSPQDGKL